MSTPTLSPDLVASARHLATANIRGLREQIDHARRLTAIGAPGRQSDLEELECAAVLIREIEWFQIHLKSRGLWSWLNKQGPKPKRRRATGVRA